MWEYSTARGVPRESKETNKTLKLWSDTEPLAARERTGQLYGSKLFSNEQRHGLTLLVDYVLKSMPDIRVPP